MHCSVATEGEHPGYFPERREDLCGQSAVEPQETIDMTTNPTEPATDAVNRTAQEILAALQAKDAAKVNSYYAPDAVIATAPPGGQDGRAVSQAIRDDIADPNFTMSLSNEQTEVAGSGDLAYRRGTFKITYTNPQTKQAENGAGTYDRLQEAGGRQLEGGGRFRSVARRVRTNSGGGKIWVIFPMDERHALLRRDSAAKSGCFVSKRTGIRK